MTKRERERKREKEREREREYDKDRCSQTHIQTDIHFFRAL